MELKKIHWRIWFVRKIRKGGRVKIAGKWYRVACNNNDPNTFPYDGRLDGKFYLFGRYKKPTMFGEEGYEDHVFCWGPAENSGKDPEQWIDDPQVVNGYYYWPMWYDENTRRDEIRKQWENK